MKEKSASRELGINTIIFGISTLGSKIVMFFLMPIYTTYLTTTQLGTAELVVNFMNLIYPIASLNIISALLRFSMEKGNEKKDVLFNTLIITILGILISGILLLIVHLNSSIEDWKEYLWILLFTYSLEQIVSVYSKATDRTLDFAIGNILYTVSLFVISTILIIIFKRGTNAYFEGIILSNIVATIYFIFRLQLYKILKKSKIDIKLIKKMLIFSIPLIFNSISWWLNSFFDRFVLEHYHGESSVGIYSASSKIPAIVTAVCSVFLQAWVLSAIKQYEEGSNSTFIKNVFKKFSALCVIVSSIIIILCKNIVFLINRGDFNQSWEFVPFLVCASMFGSIAGFFAAFYTSAKKNKDVMISTLISSSLNIILNFILIPRYSIQGAVIATLISQIVLAIYRIFNSRKFIKFDINFKSFFTSTIIVLIQAYLTIKEANIGLNLILSILVFLIYINEIKSMIKLTYEKIVKLKKKISKKEM